MKKEARENNSIHAFSLFVFVTIFISLFLFLPKSFSYVFYACQLTFPHSLAPFCSVYHAIFIFSSFARKVKAVVVHLVHAG